MAEVASLALLAAAAWASGSALLRRLPWPELRRFERVSLECTAGLGIVALVLSIAALAGWFSQATAILAALIVVAGALSARLKGSRSFEAKGSRSFEAKGSRSFETKGSRSFETKSSRS